MSRVAEHQVHINTTVTYDGADVREDQKVKRQMLWANRAAADWAKAARLSKALNARSDGSNCSNGVTFTSTVHLRLPCRLAELTGSLIQHNAQNRHWLYLE